MVPSRASGTETTYYSNGKLLLTGEYVVLDGAKALALATTLGQSLTVEETGSGKIIWKSLDENGNIWFEDTFEIVDNGISSATLIDNSISNRLIEILQATKTINPNFINDNHGFNVTTKLSFPRNWGLGTSSTLINNVAQWANIDAYKLLKLTFGGSGYDIACAQYNTPITYQLKNAQPEVLEVGFNPLFKDHLYFVYLNKKQNSREGIALYKSNASVSKQDIESITRITHEMVSCDSLKTFEVLMQEHERIISKATKQTPIKERLFHDFKGSIKSLGAWGGDFILVASQENPRGYFERKGYTTIINYSELIKI
nr:GYDIA family GHMP kinase [Aestuariivivens insulae]